MSIKCRPLPVLAIGLFTLIAAFSLVGCHESAGGTDEICNYTDDNWDGIVDDPFVDALGRYISVMHCGDCGVNCAEVFPLATAVECFVPESSDSKPLCRITDCPDGTHLVGSACVQDEGLLCLPCETDNDCAIADPGALCVTLPNGDTRCGTPCDLGDDQCLAGFECTEPGNTPQCTPISGSCACTPEHEGQVFGCWIDSPDGETACPGRQICEGTSLTECEPVLEDICDGKDNDCNGTIDDDFLTGDLYIDDDHCGACNHPCVPPAANMESHCIYDGSSPGCVFSCLFGFVDLDGVSLNGCECEMTAGSWPPTAHGGDGNCDGTLDDMSTYIYVSKNGNDGNPGTLAAPVLTIGQGIVLAAPTGKTVFVAQGVYDEDVHLSPGVSLFGGYNADFSDRDTVIFPVVLTNTSATTGHPVLYANGIQTSTEVAGFDIEGTNAASPGAGSTTVLIKNCGPDLFIWDLTVIAGQSADGIDGDSSAEILADMGIPSPAQLDGTSGTNGAGGFDANTIYCFGQFANGGNGGNKTCPVSMANVGGGYGGDSSCPNTGCSIGSPCGNAGCSDYMVGSVCDYAAVYAAAVPNPAAGNGFGPGAGSGGDLTYDAPTTMPGISFCDDNPTLRREGGPGGNGAGGTSGAGGIGFTDPDGYFNILTGIWTAGDGTDGGDGTNGGGGGGGTQGNGYDMLPGVGGFYDDHLGGAGGGGGSGGCGPPAATGGTGGGSSIGIVIVLTSSNTGPVFDQVRIVPAGAGDGGNGGIGLAGGTPGTGGLGGDGNFWCARHGGKGGDGGSGGAAGGGGGGAGGSISGFHVIPGAPATPVAYMLALTAANSVDPLPAPGSAGATGYSPGNSGSAGVAGTALAFRIY